MKLFQLIALSAILTIGAFSVISYTSCTRDACKGTTCLNGGTCSAGACQCPTGWLGANCQTRAFVGVWAGADSCHPVGRYNVSMTLTNSATDTSKIVIENLGAINGTIFGYLSPDGTTVTYNNQVVYDSSVADTISGTLKLNSNTSFTNVYTIHKDSTTFSCSGSYSKQ